MNFDDEPKHIEHNQSSAMQKQSTKIKNKYGSMPGNKCNLLLTVDDQSPYQVPIVDSKSSDDEILSFMRSKLHSNQPLVIQPRDTSFQSNQDSQRNSLKQNNSFATTLKSFGQKSGIEVEQVEGDKNISKECPGNTYFGIQAK